jgi:hypothetical protein
MRYSICYLSPHYYLYNEETNKLMMRDHDQVKVRSKKQELESNYIDELSNEDGECYFLKEKYTMEEAIYKSKEYEDESMPYIDDPETTYMRPATPAEIKDNHYGPGWYIELKEKDSKAKEYWKFIPDLDWHREQGVNQ